MIHSAGEARIVEDVTLSEHLEETGFAYDPQFPPDCAEGKPLSSVRDERPAQEPVVKRALKSCARLFTPQR
jgi:hypothetical protein